MRISIWQQFSSNHSGYFWVAGTFKGVEDARHAYDELRHILFEIDQWHREHKEDSAAAVRAGNSMALPPEAAFAAQYDVEWPHTIDWTNFADYWLEDYPGFESLRPSQVRSQELIDDAVTIVGRVVTVSNPDQTWMTTQPFQGLLERFGATTIGFDFDSTPGEDLVLRPVVRFTAPDEATADRIEKAIRTYLTSKMLLNPPDDLPPWHDDEANFRQALGTSRILRQEDVEILTQVWQRRYRLHTLPDPSPAGLAMPAQRLALRDIGLTIDREGLNFSLWDLWFYNQELGLSALIAHLEVNGCTGIDFDYSTQSSADEE